ncbi:unnamed protein product [Agarophyton chilense]
MSSIRMVLVSFIVSLSYAIFYVLKTLYYLLLLLLVPITFLWIIGKFSEKRIERETPQQRQPSASPQAPSPDAEQVLPRRLSFSAALASTPTPSKPRRVTFSLTPEQQLNEYFKTAVPRRASRPNSASFVEAEPSSDVPLLELFPSPYKQRPDAEPSPRPQKKVAKQNPPIERPQPLRRVVPRERAQQIWSSGATMPFQVPKPLRRSTVPVYADDMR